MATNIPESLRYFLKNGLEDCDDGFEYCSELNRILNSDQCQHSLSGKEIDTIRDFADDIKKVGEFNYYSRERVRKMEEEKFGRNGILGFLGGEPDNGSSQSALDGLFKF